MYEEEDDDLPMQYRRLTAHLQTGSADFNRRLAAYLTNQVAMRSAVEQMANNPYHQQFGPHAMPYAQPRQNMFQSPVAPQQHQMSQPNSVPNSYRQTPYPSPHHPGFRPNHGRAYSAAVIPPVKVQTPPTPMPHSLDHRRMSTPANIPQLDVSGIKADPEYVRQTQSAQVPQGHFNPYWQDTGLFSSSLPPESQQMLAGAPALDPKDPFSQMLLHGSEQYTTHPYYPWGGMQQGIKAMPVHPSAYHGMSTTLAPSALTTQPESMAGTPSSNPPTMIDGQMPPSSSDPLGLNHYSLTGKECTSPYSLGSGQNTPGESFWSNFVQDGGWEENTAGS